MKDTCEPLYSTHATSFKWILENLFSLLLHGLLKGCLRISHLRLSIKEDVFKIFAKFIGPRPATLLKSDSSTVAFL